MTELNRVLFVDDEPDIRTVATLALADVGGLDVKGCESGDEALAEVVGFAPDLILLDVMMPGMDGPTTLQKLREIPEIADIPVVFFTAKTQKSDIDKLQELGAVSVLRKPFDPLKLADEIREVWKDVAAGEKPVNPQNAVHSELEALTAAFLRDADNQIVALRSAADSLAEVTGSDEIGRQLSLIVEYAHKLAGRGGTFGFPEISEVASRLETTVADLLESGPTSAPDLTPQLEPIGTMIDDLEQATRETA